MSGFVYLIGTSVFGWYKIGKSVDANVRVNQIGVLLPFKIKVFQVWRAENHHLMEKSLHEIYAHKRINGEWFEFSKDEIRELIEAIPYEARVDGFSTFSNIEEDTKNNRRVLGLRVQKLRGDFTLEEREQKRQEAIEQQRKKKLERAAESDKSAA